MLLKRFALNHIWLLLAALASLASSVPVSLITKLTQANYKLAWLIDSQDWSAFDTVVAQNVTFDGTDLLPAKGGIANGLDEVIEVFQHDAADGARTSHLVANVLAMETYGRSRARVNSYIAYSHWVEGALYGPIQTFRIWYRRDDRWVLEQGGWKVEYMKIYNMGYGIEAPYYDRKDGLSLVRV